MGKGKKQAEEDFYGQVLLTVGMLVVVGGALLALHRWSGLPGPAFVALTAGALLLLGYVAWWVKSRIKRAWAKDAPQAPSAAVAEKAPAEPQEPRHEVLTNILTRAGSIGRGPDGTPEYIRLEDVSIDQLDVGTRYRILLPEGRTHEGVSRNLDVIASMFGVTRLHIKFKGSRKSERAVELLVLKEEPFAHPFNPPTRDEIKSFKGVPLGHEPTGEMAGVPTFSRASLLVAGMAQMGKTTLITGLITCLILAYGEFELYLLDGKFCGLAEFERIAQRYEASDDPAVLESILDELNARVDRRYIKIKQAKTDRQSPPKFIPVFFIIDEAADFFADNGTPKSKELVARVTEKMRKLVAKSLESEISTIILTQRPDKDAIPTKVRSQFQYRICMYVGGEGDAKVALGDDYFNTVAPISPVRLNPSIKGQGVLYAEGQSRLIRGFEFSNEFKWEVIDEREKHLSQTGSQASLSVIEAPPQTPLDAAIRILKERGEDFISSADLGPALGITAPTPGAQGLKLSKALGIRSGKKEGSDIRGYSLDALMAAARGKE
ncbi:FtsK/SpoIIIE domain-containing protein [Streptomyces sp. 049-1]|uniref:FtsK/SpoIIIE domain-containing protein n=1 Tax=Streptomyces sp. 049-1 TaxID=2789264 RepID=UPI00397F2FBD